MKIWSLVKLISAKMPNTPHIIPEKLAKLSSIRSGAKIIQKGNGNQLCLEQVPF